MLYFGTGKIPDMRLGTEEIRRAYLGETLVFYRGLYPSEDLYPREGLYPEAGPTEKEG